MPRPTPVHTRGNDTGALFDSIADCEIAPDIDAGPQAFQLVLDQCWCVPTLGVAFAEVFKTLTAQLFIPRHHFIAPAGPPGQFVRISISISIEAASGARGSVRLAATSAQVDIKIYGATAWKYDTSSLQQTTTTLLHHRRILLHSSYDRLSLLALISGTRTCILTLSPLRFAQTSFRVLISLYARLILPLGLLFVLRVPCRLFHRANHAQ
ncbi:hypothetical protein BDR05DRAFT_1006574 [Suillus weaverae]|nr:hypothetical protein BDR05DRAFT_1006574 [Suillus weaverae]